MNILKKVEKSRIVLKELLSNEWDTSTLPILSTKELDVLYNTKPQKNSIDNIIGNGSKCSFTLDNRLYKEHKLHVIYLNFPDINKQSSKITRAIITKINNLYENFYNDSDNILIIINEKLNPTITKLIDVINLNNNKFNMENKKLQTIIDEFNKQNMNITETYFRTVHVLSIDSIQVNLLNHNYIPTHKPIRDKNKINTILKESNATINQLPVINKYDIISRIILLNTNDIVEINRPSTKCGEYNYYRVCK